MSSLIFAHAKTIRNKAKKHATSMADLQENLGHDRKQAYDDAYNQIIRNETNEFKEILKIARDLHEVYTDTLGLETKNWYFITIRPEHNKITLDEFIELVKKYINRKCFLECTVSFEQKGISHDTLGNGFHCHIVSKNTWRSKGEALRDTISTFNKCCAPNCIEIIPTRNPNEIINNYMIEYKSNDGHKECTKQWDTIWRDNVGIKNIYSRDDLSLSSPHRERSYITNDPMIVSWN